MFKSPVNLSDIESNVLKELFLYWCKIRGARSIPRRKDFRPIDVPHLLPYIAMVNVEQDTKKYQIRLVGTETAEVTGKSIIGQYLDDIPGMSKSVDRFDWVVKEKLPYLYHGRLSWSEKDFLEYDALGLPFSNDNFAVNIIMAGLVYSFPSETVCEETEASCLWERFGR
ncbi:PAS domain-containing protein [Emcibacter nanhaiensis]|uniref:PAS domain-containing protein n=1 Tax=Emcibacter nanhaiensis TaxID=1505037 RepID=A0A501PHQ9_9PROT|nr:PAS domain-containing protein [Emcibacter nanhaiensis]TPD60013.1 PAS domain-containing protein [Emcibacter nanhaiensis]